MDRRETASRSRRRTEQRERTGYDDLYRLTLETVTNTLGLVYQKNFVYDDVGNRLTQTTTGQGAATVDYSYDTRDRLLTENLANYGWDDNGNLRTKSGEATYFWDLEDRLVRVEKTDGTVVTHAYDADGNRVRTEVTPSTGPPEITNFLVDLSGSLSHAVAESNDSGAFLAYYVRGDDLLSVVRQAEQRYYHADGLGSIRALTDENGNLADSYEYTAFGELRAQVGTDGQPYQFAGEPFEANAAFYYNRARWMDPRVGRFAGMDPFPGSTLEPASVHRYLYASADPANAVDPSGETTLATVAVTIGIVAVVAATAVAVNYWLANPGSHRGVLDAATEAKVRQLHPLVQPLARAHIRQLIADGLKPKITAGFRSFEDQDILFARGRTTAGPRVTNARGGESYHNFGVAYDIALFDEKGRYITNGSDPRYTKAGTIGEDLKLEWGGRWEDFFDPSHFQYTKGIDIATMRERYESGKDVFTKESAWWWPW